MEQVEFGAGDAVRADQQPGGPQHPPEFAEQGVLQVAARHVVQRGERGHGGEAAGRQRQIGAVGVQYIDVAPDETFREPAGEVTVHLDGGEPGNQAAQHVGGQPGPRADLQHVVPQVPVADRPRQDLLADDRGPLRARAEPQVLLVHRGSASLLPVIRSVIGGYAGGHFVECGLSQK